MNLILWEVDLLARTSVHIGTILHWLFHISVNPLSLANDLFAFSCLVQLLSRFEGILVRDCHKLIAILLNALYGVAASCRSELMLTLFTFSNSLSSIDCATSSFGGSAS